MKKIAFLFLLSAAPCWADLFSGSPAPVNSNNFIQNTNSLQSGATFYVSSGTVNGNLNVGGTLTLDLGGTGNADFFMIGSGSYGIRTSVPSQWMQFFVNGQSNMAMDASHFILSGSDVLQFLSGGIGNPADTGIGRNAAGVLEINNGSSGQLRDLTARYVTASSMTFTGASAPPDSFALCLLNGQVGHCTSVVGVGGGCTCSVP